MIFSTDMLLEENYIQPTKLKKFNPNKDYFNEALKFIREAEDSISEAKRNMYEKLSQSPDNGFIAHEGVKEYASYIINYIDECCDIVKESRENFFKTTKNIPSLSENTMEWLLSNFNESDSFTIEGYEYQNLGEDATQQPYNIYSDICESGTVVNRELEGEFFRPLTEDAKIALNNILYEAKSSVKRITSNIFGEETALDNFNEALWEFYRGSAYPTNIEISPSILEEYVDCLVNHEDYTAPIGVEGHHLIESFNKIRRDICLRESSLNTIFSNVTPVDESEYAKDPTPIDTKADSIWKVKLEQARDICTMYLMNYEAKLTAVTEFFNQCNIAVEAALGETPGFKISNDIDNEYKLFDESFSYLTYLGERTTNQLDILSYISESVSLDEYGYVNESAVDAIKGIITKIVEAVKGAFKKFTERLSELTTSNAVFLEKYKNLIMNNAFKDHELTMYDYKYKEIMQLKVPEFSNMKWESFIKSDSESSREEEFVKLYAQELGINPNDTGDLKDKLTNRLRGENEIETSMPALEGMKVEMYQFCKNYDATVNLLNKDYEIIDKNQRNLNAIIAQQAAKLERDAKNPSQEQPATKPEESSSGDSNNNSTPSSNDNNSTPSGDSSTSGSGETVDQSAAIISSTMSSLTEKMNIGDVRGTGNSNKNTNSTAGATVSSTATSNTDEKNQVAAQQIRTSANIDNLEANKQGDELKKYQEHVKDFFTFCSTVVTVKMNLCVAMLKDYMKILRQHVRDYGGDTSNTSGSAPAKDKSFELVNGDKKVIFNYRGSKAVNPKVKPIVDDADTFTAGDAAKEIASTIGVSELKDNMIFSTGSNNYYLYTGGSFKRVTNPDDSIIDNTPDNQNDQNNQNNGKNRRRNNGKNTKQNQNNQNNKQGKKNRNGK